MENENVISNLLSDFQLEIVNLDVKSALVLKNRYLQHEKIKKIRHEIHTLDQKYRGRLSILIKNYSLRIDEICEEYVEKMKRKEKFVDCSLPVRKVTGSLHPMTVVKNRIRTIIRLLNFRGLMFNEESSNEIEDGFYNFDALNIPPLHPCRNDHQSFFLENGMMLRTQCTSTSARIIERNKNSDGAYFTIGKVYRRDLDATHLPQFNQCDILVIHSDANFASLLKFVKMFLNTFFGKMLKYRFRPSHFPFTDFSTEVDIWFDNRWLEVLGCGIVNKNVFDKCESEYRMAFALGMGVERLAMILYSISDIRTLYSVINGFDYMGGKYEIKS